MRNTRGIITPRKSRFPARECCVPSRSLRLYEMSAQKKHPLKSIADRTAEKTGQKISDATIGQFRVDKIKAFDREPLEGVRVLGLVSKPAFYQEPRLTSASVHENRRLGLNVTTRNNREAIRRRSLSALDITT